MTILCVSAFKKNIFKDMFPEKVMIISPSGPIRGPFLIVEAQNQNFIFHNVLMKSVEMDKLWKFASNAERFELKDIVAALDEIQVKFTALEEEGDSRLYLELTFRKYGRTRKNFRNNWRTP